MDDRDFRKHLQELAHGHHHPEEHDWGGDGAPDAAAKPKAKTKPARTSDKEKK